MLMIKIEKINVTNKVLYRPPGTETTAFKKVVEAMETDLTKLEEKERTTTIYLMGVLNFPFLEWRKKNIGCNREEKKGNRIEGMDERE